MPGSRMDDETAARLNALNQAFYRSAGEAFDATRGQPWPGWSGLLPLLRTPLSVLDVGCGNGRLARFLQQALGGGLTFHGIDSDAGLLAHARERCAKLPGLALILQQADVLTDPLPDRPFGLVTLFGLLHHIPGLQRRLALMTQAAACVAPGGLLCFACWRFAEYERFRQRIVPFPDGMTTEPGDALLDWRAGTHALRYCHHADDAEIDALCEATGLTLLSAYRADGFSGAVNAYRILQRPAPP